MGSHSTQIPPLPGAPELRHNISGSDGSDTSLTDALATLRSRIWLLILGTILGISYGTYKAETQPKIFTAYGIIEVHNGASNEYKLNADYDFFGDSQTKMNTEVRILESDSLLTRVAREMNLANNPDFFGVKGPINNSLDDPSIHAGVIGTLQGNLHISLVPKTEMIQIGYSSPSPQLAADIVNKVIYLYTQLTYELPVESQKRVADFLLPQLDDLKRDVESSQEQMMELQRRLGVLGYDSTHNQLTDSLESLLGASTAAKLKRIDAESSYVMLKSMDPMTMAGFIELTPGTAPGQLGALRGQILSLQAEYAQMTAPNGLGPNHPRVKALTAQIEELKSQLATEQNRLVLQAKESYLAAQAVENQTQAELEARKADSYKQRDDLVEYTLRQREFEQNRTLYEGLQSRLRTAAVQAGLESVEVDEVDKALPPVAPTLQPKSTIVLSTTLLFLVISIVLAFILDSLDTNLSNIAEIESVMDLPSLAIIPKGKRAPADQSNSLSVAQRNINVLTQPKSQFSESFRSLRTALMLSRAGHTPKYILFTSATPSEGKTTIVSNLACVLAQRDAKILLIDADLRRPNVHHRFGLTGKVGLTTLLAGTSSLEESLQRVPEVPNLDILPSGPVPPFPTEMLSSDAMLSLLERVGNMYTHIVIDSPPILSVTDGVILSRVVDAVVLVIRHGKMNKNVIRRARDLLVRSGAPLAGIALNAVDMNSPEYYGYYGYSGYSYSSVDSESWEAQVPSAAATSQGLSDSNRTGPEGRTKQ
jgi:polysaccharide biosynthesis transport protein